MRTIEDTKSEYKKEELSEEERVQDALLDEFTAELKALAEKYPTVSLFGLAKTEMFSSKFLLGVWSNANLKQAAMEIVQGAMDFSKLSKK